MKRTITFVMLITLFFTVNSEVMAKTIKKSTSTTHSSLKKSSSPVNSNGTDLTLFDVTGKVKSITYHGNRDYCAPSPFYYGKPILFSEKGDCTNLNEILQTTMDCHRRVRIKRNNLGEIENIDNSDYYGEDGGSVTLEWKDGLVGEFRSYEGISGAENSMRLKYKDGRISSMEGGGCMDGWCHNSSVSFYNFKEDSHGNWIECTMTIVKENFDDNEYIDTDNITLNINRIITYYP